MHRNIGNQVPGNDLNAQAVLEYAVTHLGVTDIIVTGAPPSSHLSSTLFSSDSCSSSFSGHYDCGAVRAATKRQDLGLLENWLRLIRDVYRLHKDYIDLIDVSKCF